MSAVDYLRHEALKPRNPRLTIREHKLYSFFEAFQGCVDAQSGFVMEKIDHPEGPRYEHCVEFWTNALMTKDQVCNFMKLGYSIIDDMNDEQQRLMIDFIGGLPTETTKDYDILESVHARAKELLHNKAA